MVFNSPPGWPSPPPDWRPPEGWAPDPSWPLAPEGWIFWVPAIQAAPQTPPVAQPPLGGPPPYVPPAGPAERVGASPTISPTSSEADLVASLRAEIDALRAELAARAAVAASAPSSVIEMSDEQVLQEVGIYRYHHPLETSVEYRTRLNELNEKIKELVKAGQAVLASDMFTFNNSLAKGRKMTSDFSKLMLRAFNAEADNCVRSLRAGNVVTAKKRLNASADSIAKLGSMMEMRISPEYHALRDEELELTADFLIKVQEEKERAREEREELREQRKVEAEIAANREKLDKELAHYQNAIESLRSSGGDSDEALAPLLAQLTKVEGAIADNDYRAANVRAGYVYVISNPGAFGNGVVKIGMTRRLEPMDRVKELGDASVPFPFDVHALFFADDAVSLENALHKTFAERRLNRVNERREFFFATPVEVREALAEHVGSLLEFTEHPESTQYLQSKSSWPPR